MKLQQPVGIVTRLDQRKLHDHNRSMHTDDITITLPSRRDVRLRQSGSADGFPVLALHGTPGSRLKFDAAHEPARALGLRIIAPDRWGYGGTAAPRSPVLSGYADDLAAMADALGLGRFGLLAISGGGPFAAVAAACLGERLAALALVGPVGPIAGCPLPGTSLLHQISFRVVPRLPGATRLLFGALRLGMRHAPELAIAAAMARAPGSDHEIMSDPVLRQGLAATFAEGLARSTCGAVIDMRMFADQWRPEAPKAPSRVWLGAADGNISVPAARHLASLLDAEIAILEGAGHYWVARNWPEVLGWLAAHAR